MIYYEAKMKDLSLFLTVTLDGVTYTILRTKKPTPEMISIAILAWRQGFLMGRDRQVSASVTPHVTLNDLNWIPKALTGSLANKVKQVNEGLLKLK